MMENVHPANFCGTKSRGVRRNKKKVYGIRCTVHGILDFVVFSTLHLKPCTLYRFAYAAVTRDEGNAADGRFPTASTIISREGPWLN